MVEQALAEFKDAKKELMNAGATIGKAFDQLAQKYDQLVDAIEAERQPAPTPLERHFGGDLSALGGLAPSTPEPAADEAPAAPPAAE